mmetsp:Transcript_13848/g.18143  ORF Transcript_13848/g.18143 Transcript_13848/m.18143 type:complete len:209 (-) Transcript_13848:26-652(-)
MDAPAWMQETAAAPPAAPPLPENARQSSSLEVDAESSKGGGEDAEITVTAEVAKVVLLMRLANMVVAVLLCVSAGFQFNFSNAADFVLAVYAIIGGVLIFLMETQLKFIRIAISLNFGFMFSSWWRFLYYILLAAMAWEFGGIFDQIVAIAIVAIALFNSYVLCSYPSYRAMRDKIAEEEDKKIEARISQEVKNQVVQSATVAASKGV